jgi:hypothetical protein
LKDRLRIGALAEPQGKVWGKRAWTLAELRALNRSLDPGPTYLGGLPRLSWHRTERVAQICGVKYERLRYLLRRGVAEGPSGRDGSGRRQWSEADVEALLSQPWRRAGTATIRAAVATDRPATPTAAVGPGDADLRQCSEEDAPPPERGGRLPSKSIPTRRGQRRGGVFPFEREASRAIGVPGTAVVG